MTRTVSNRRKTPPADRQPGIMTHDWTGSASRWMQREAEEMTTLEKSIIELAAARRTVARDLSAIGERETAGDRIADKLTIWAGSWTFILLFLGFLVLWSLVNTVIMSRAAFDPYPYVFLNLILSMLAAIQAPIILMAQNRQAERDREAARHDYEVNLKADIEIMALHEKIDAMRREEIHLLGEELRAARAEVTALSASLVAQKRRGGRTTPADGGQLNR